MPLFVRIPDVIDWIKRAGVAATQAFTAPMSIRSVKPTLTDHDHVVGLVSGRGVGCDIALESGLEYPCHARARVT